MWHTCTCGFLSAADVLWKLFFRKCIMYMDGHAQRAKDSDMRTFAPSTTYRCIAPGGRRTSPLVLPRFTIHPFFLSFIY